MLIIPKKKKMGKILGMLKAAKTTTKSLIDGGKTRVIGTRKSSPGHKLMWSLQKYEQ